MSIKVQYVSATIADTSNNSVVTSFEPVSALNRAFVMPATTMQHCGIGYVGSQENRQYWVTADLTAVDSLTFQRGGTSGVCPCAAWIVEFTGESGDSDEFIMRGKTTTSLTISDDSVDSVAIAGVADVSKVVPILHVRAATTGNHSQMFNIMTGVEMATSGSDIVNRLTRIGPAANSPPTAIVYNVEWIHSDTTVISGTLVDSTSNAARNTTIASVTNVNQAFIYSVLKSINDPDDVTYYAELTSATNLRTRLLNGGSSGDTIYYWIIRNPNFSVQHVSAVDGSSNWADGSDPQTEQVNITAVDRTRSFVRGWAGSSSTVSTDFPASVWNFRFADDDTVEAYRAESVGTSEYTFQVVTFPEPVVPDPEPTITDAGSWVDGGIYTITGSNFGEVEGEVRVGGVPVAVTSWSDTVISGPSSQGNHEFGVNKSVVVETADAEVSNSLTIQWQLPFGHLYVSILDTSADPEHRLVPVPDLDVSDQIQVSQITGIDVSQFQILANGTWIASEGLLSFLARVWDSTDSTWGAWALQVVVVEDSDGPTPLPPNVRTIGCPT